MYVEVLLSGRPAHPLPHMLTCPPRESEAPYKFSSGTHRDGKTPCRETHLAKGRPSPQPGPQAHTSGAHSPPQGAQEAVQARARAAVFQSSWVDDPRQRFSVSLTTAIVNGAWLKRDIERHVLGLEKYF